LKYFQTDVRARINLGFYQRAIGTARFDWYGAQLESGAFATSYIPTSGTAATRAADVASITGSNFGVTRTNLLVRSEEFDDAAWTKSNSSITANTIVAPDGTLTGDKLVEDTATAAHQLTVNLPFDYVSGTTYTLSCYIKAASRSKFQLAWRSDWFPSDNNLTADLSTGTISVGVNATGTITAVGNGWYRISVTSTADATGSSPSDLFMRLVSDAGSLTYTGDGTSGLYIWGAQLEVGSAVTPYIQSPSVFTSRASSGTYVGGNGLIQTATTNEARYDHDPISLIGKGLLLEEARTNVVTWSQDFSQADWTKNASTVVTTAVASPIQGVNYQKIEATSANTTVGITSVAVTAATQQRAVSFFAQPLGNISRVLVVVQGADARINVNLADGTFTTNAAATGSTVAVSGQRFSVSTPTLTNATGVRFFLKQTGDTDTDTPTTIAIGEGLYLIGAQMEVGAFPTSYIPTTTATVTRAADISTSVATSVFESSWYNATSSSVFAEWKTLASSMPSGSAQWLAEFSNGTTSDRQSLFQIQAANALISQNSFFGGAGAGRLDAGGPYVNTNSKVASSYAALDRALVANGGSIASSTAGVLPIGINQVNIGSSLGTAPLNGHIRRLTYWPTRLGNEVLQRITQ
jgi:hypothetical protein